MYVYVICVRYACGIHLCYAFVCVRIICSARVGASVGTAVSAKAESDADDDHTNNGENGDHNGTRWLFFNDHSVSAATVGQVESSQAYLAFYQKLPATGNGHGR